MQSSNHLFCRNRRHTGPPFQHLWKSRISRIPRMLPKQDFIVWFHCYHVTEWAGHMFASTMSEVRFRSPVVLRTNSVGANDSERKTTWGSRLWMWVVGISYVWGRCWSEFIGDYGTSVKYALEIQIPPKVWCFGYVVGLQKNLLRRYLGCLEGYL